MVEFPRRHSVARRLNGFMEGLVTGELARIQKRASGGRLEMREILIKRRRTRLNSVIDHANSREFSSLALYTLFHPIFLNAMSILCLRARDRTWLSRLKLLPPFSRVHFSRRYNVNFRRNKIT